MGVVYHAIDPNIGRPVAIKTIRLADVRKPEEQSRLRERLFREARSAGILSHPGIVTVYDVEQQDDVAYIAMEYVDGPTLDQLLSEDHPISSEQMFAILGQTAVALDYAHAKGIVHRDIKPANVMIASDGMAKITDFGIAKITASEQFTMTGTIVGTPHYMSPEQVQGLIVDGRADQFSLGVIAFEMLTGEKPFTGEQLTTVVYKIVAEEPVPPHRLNQTLSSPIEAVLRKVLAKKPENRYETCQEFIEALEQACADNKGWKTMPRGGSLSEPTVLDGGAPAVSLPPARRRSARSETLTAETTEKRKSGFLPFLLAILMAAALLALIGFQAMPWLSPRANRTASSSPPPASKTAPQTPPQQTPPPATPPAPADTKPSPLPASQPAAASATPPPASAPPETQAAQEPAPSTPPVESAAKPVAPETAQQQPEQQLPQRARLAPQAVTVVSSPGGATATLDGQPGVTCTTPCALQAPPGQHTISIVKPGFQVEHREVQVSGGAIEVPPVMLHALGGTLMLTTDPKGATVSVDGKRIPQTTPAQITLGPGSHHITVERDGKEITRTVEIRDSGINYLKIPLE